MRTFASFALFFLLSLAAVPAHSQTTYYAYRNWCQVGGQQVNTANLLSVTKVQASYPSCTVTVNAAGSSSKALIFSNTTGTPLGNPFTAQTDAYFIFYGVSGFYDVTISGGGMPAPKTFQQVFLGGAGGGGGGGCSVGGIPTTGGIVDGDVTSTNCGTGNRASDTVDPPAYVQTFGYQNGTGNGANYSVLIGNGNGDALQGVDVIGIGDFNLRNNTGGGFAHTIVLGTGSLVGVTNGGGDLFIAGQGAGNWLNAPADMIAIGNGAGGGQSGLLSVLDNAIFLGDAAGAHASGTNMVGIGQGASAQYLPGASEIIGIGNGAGTGLRDPGTFLPTCAPSNVIGIGNAAAFSNCGSNAIAMGNRALGGYPSGQGNVDPEVIAIGHSAADTSTGGGDDVAIGWFAGASNSGGINVFIGDSAGYQNTGDVQVFIGNSAGQDNTGDTTVGIGENAARKSTSSFSDFIGDNAGYMVTNPWTVGDYWDCMGYDSCQNGSAVSGTLGSYNVGIGAFSAGDVEGNYNVGLGYAAGGYRTGHDNVAIGQGAGSGKNLDGTTPGAGNDNVAIGEGAGKGIGSHVIAIGHDAIQGPGGATPHANTGDENIGVGDHALTANLSGTGNVGIGQYAGSVGWVNYLTPGFANQTGSNNTWIGDFSGPSTATQLSNTIALGYQAYNTLSNQTVIGNPSMSSLTIFGSGDGCLSSSSGVITGSGPCGGGGLSGQTTGYLPLATSATASTTSSALQDTGSSLVYHGTGTQHGFAFPASSGGLVTPVPGSAGLGTDASGLWNAYENGGSWSRLCTVGNGLCSGTVGVSSIDAQTGAFTFTGAGVSHVGNAYTFSGGGGSSAFSALTGSTNTTAAMLVGTGASLAPTGTGTIQATTIASSETVASSTTPTFSVSFNVSYTVLTGNITTFTLAAGSDGQSKTLTFCQNGTGNFTVAPPANVHGFLTVGLTASTCSSQHYNYSTAQTAWLADSPGAINQ